VTLSDGLHSLLGVPVAVIGEASEGASGLSAVSLVMLASVS
jgi:hypothetical protein